MKILTFAGVLLLIIGFILIKIQGLLWSDLSVTYGGLMGIGIGLIIGGIVGYISKSQAVLRRKKEEDLKKALQQKVEQAQKSSNQDAG